MVPAYLEIGQSLTRTIYYEILVTYQICKIKFNAVQASFSELHIHIDTKFFVMIVHTYLITSAPTEMAVHCCEFDFRLGHGRVYVSMQAIKRNASLLINCTQKLMYMDITQWRREVALDGNQLHTPATLPPGKESR